MKRLLSPLLILVFACQALALDIPKPSGYVNDLAGVLDANQKQKLEAKFSQWEKETSNELSVLTIKSLEGENITDYSFRVAEAWGVGKSDKDNGMLLLISLNDRKWWIQIGEGLEGVMPDGKAGLILDNTLPGYFRKGDFYGGINDASNKLMRGVGQEYTASPSRSYAPQNANPNSPDPGIILLIVVGVAFVIGIIIFLVYVSMTEDVGSGYSYRPQKPYIPSRSTTTYIPPVRTSSSKKKKKKSSSSSSSSTFYIPTPSYSPPKRRSHSSSSSSSSSYGGGSSYGGSFGGGSFGGFGGGGFSGGGAGGGW